MKDQVLLLMKLQEVDLKKSQHQIEAKALPEKRQAAERILAEKKEAFVQMQKKLAEMDKGKRDKEMDLKVQEEQVVKLRDRLIKLKTNDEYKANIKEIESAKVKKGEMEESLLVLMEEGDNLKKEVATSAQAITDAELQFQVEKGQIEAAIAELTVTAQSINAEWLSLSEMLDQNMLEDYKKLIIDRKGLAVVALTGTSCSGCHFSLPPQLVTQVRTGEKILTCTYCHRMLYVPSKIE